MEKYFKLSDFGIIDNVTIHHYVRQCDPEEEIKLKWDTECAYDSNGRPQTLYIHGVTFIGEENIIREVFNCVQKKCKDKKVDRK